MAFVTSRSHFILFLIKNGVRLSNRTPLAIFSRVGKGRSGSLCPVLSLRRSAPLFDSAQGIGPGRSAQILIVYMGIDLGGLQIIIKQHLLKGAHVHAVLEHQGCRGMAQLVGGVLCAVQSCGG